MSKTFQKKRLVTAISAAITCSLSASVFAQEVDTDEPDSAEQVEVVEVKGMRSSLLNAQNLKRYADTVKDLITASDIGALPDKSVTEALQRVPGVTIERFASSDDPKHYADEGTGVLVRGLDRVRSEINGRDAFSANPYGGLSYEDFPAELLGAVEVVKNQTADLISGGIAGTVNLITRKPFDSDKRLVSFNAKAHYGDFRKETTPSFSALFSDNWDTDSGKFGLLIAASRSEYKTRGDGVGLGNFHSRGPVDTFSYDEWGTPSPGVKAGLYSNPCIPDASDWRACDNLGFEDTVQYTDSDAAAYVPTFEGTALTGQGEGDTWYTPAAIHMSTAENDRKRRGFTTSLQWASDDDTIVATLEHISSKASLEYRERQIGQATQGFKSEMASSHDWVDRGSDYPRTFDDNGFLTSGVGLGTHASVPLMYRTRWNYNENTVEDTSFNLQVKATDRLKLELDYQRIDSEKVVHNYGMAGQTRGGHVANVSPYFLDMRGARPTIEYLSDNILTPGYAPDENGEPIMTEPNLFLASGMEQEERNTAESDSFQFDATYSLDGVWSGISAGAYHSDKDLTVRNTNYEGWSAIGTAWIDEDRIAAAAVNRPELFERVDFSDFYNGNVLLGNVDNFLFPELNLVKNYADSLRQGCQEGWHNATSSAANDGECTGIYVPYTDKPNRVEGPFAAHNISSINEKRTEFYVRGDFDTIDWVVPVKGNIGLRYVSYDLESTGALVNPLASNRGEEGTSRNEVMQRDHAALYDIANGDALLTTVKGTDYSTVLPSLNLNFGVADDVVVRFGASKGLYYPSLLDTRNLTLMSLDYTPRLEDPSLPLSEETNPVVALDDMNLTALASNPYLEPEESINLDLTTEWYFAPAGFVSVGLFHKKLDNIIRNRQFDLNVEYGGRDYDVSAYGPANTGSGTIKGVEFSYSQFYDMLPGAWSGLGLQFNFTYIKQSDLEDPNEVAEGTLGFKEDGTRVADNRHTFRVFTGLPLQGYSDKNMNIIGMYEYEDVSFRLAYTWRSEYLLTLRESEEYAPAFAEASGMMDASFYYTINDNWKIGIEGSNLLDTQTETQYQMNQEGVRTDALNFTTDRRYALSVRAVF
ncbi:TonB-dependent receptor [Lacimicrobium alkaliphilum]|uniref:TonB-dependent receptor n=1 Tax=Lacimicrobium alkaliphilum TaxID=1526571 RepID=A0ABQ1RAR3_9ALTE|nr:TonB-dependent receptor [Lacimicrobium alkaliphilum]GGD60738.1 TonB-dependent receptor [Lacimicrobium alkaliphilum]